MGPCFVAYSHTLKRYHVGELLCSVHGAKVLQQKKSIAINIDEFLFDLNWEEVEVDRAIADLLFVGLEPDEPFYLQDKLVKIGVCSSTKQSQSLEYLYEIIKVLKRWLTLYVIQEVI